MSLKERYGKRDLVYSKWHRPQSISRFLDDQYAYNLDFIDLDAIEYCYFCKEPLALLELAKDVGQSHKSTVVCCNLANRANLPAYLVFYKSENGDIAQFRVRQVAPVFEDCGILTPKEYAELLQNFRESHYPECERCQPAARPPTPGPRGMTWNRPK